MGNAPPQTSALDRTRSDELHRKGLSHFQAGENAEAVRVYRECLAEEQRVLGEEHEGALVTMTILAWALSTAGQHAEAVRVSRDCLTLQQRLLGEEHEHTLHTMFILVSALVHGGQHADEAVRLSRDLLALEQRVEGEEHPTTLSTMSLTAWALDCAGQHEEAVLVGRECLALQQRVMGEENEGTLVTGYRLALALLRFPGEEPQAALDVVARGAQLARGNTNLLPFDQCKQDAVHALAMSAAAAAGGEQAEEEAERVARAVVEQWEEVLVEQRLDALPFARAVLCQVLLRRGQRQAAAEEGVRALADMTEAQEGHWYLATLREVLAEVESPPPSRQSSEREKPMATTASSATAQ